jgi:cytochrome c oxidase cbb3-type subunit 3
MVKNIILKVLMLAVIMIFSMQAGAQTITGVSTGMEYFLIGAVAFTVFALVLAAYLFGLNRKFQKEADLKTGRVRQTGLGKWWSDLDKKYFTKAASLEKEGDVLLDHDYDGIKELDNALPPWWKWGFYFTVIVAVIYIFRFHIIGSGPTPLQEYDREMAAAASKPKSTKDAIDERKFLQVHVFLVMEQAVKEMLLAQILQINIGCMVVQLAKFLKRSLMVFLIKECRHGAKHFHLPM